ncbi:MAG: hypothetical protein AABY22_10740 [Nanoarchaeota archaeon]
MRLSEKIKKYIFFVRKSFNFESVDAIFIGDSNGIDFLNNLKKYNMKVTMHGNEVKSSGELVEEIAAEDRENTSTKKSLAVSNSKAYSTLLFFIQTKSIRSSVISPMFINENSFIGRYPKSAPILLNKSIIE